MTQTLEEKVRAAVDAIPMNDGSISIREFNREVEVQIQAILAAVAKDDDVARLMAFEAGFEDGAAAERERLAKLADNQYEIFAAEMKEGRMAYWERIAEWIRAQGKDND